MLTGRNTAPLSESDIKRAASTFRGLDANVNTRYEPGRRSVFREVKTENGDVYGEIVFGPDIYPGRNVNDPNSALGLLPAAAHELSHYHRWHDRLQIDPEELRHLDEALTSLQAILRFDKELERFNMLELVRDAIQRIEAYANEWQPPAVAPNPGEEQPK